jgi:choline dehydrogenase-like flavoprotein
MLMILPLSWIGRIGHLHRGTRHSAARAFLRPALKRPNLTVIKTAHERVPFR